MDVLLDEIWDIATIFDVLDNGRQVIDRMQEHFAQALDVSQAAANNREGEPVKVLWLDSINADGEPFVGACCGAVQIILEHAGAVNVFEDVGVEERRSWMAVSWEEVIATDPDLIVVVEASWDSVGKYTLHLLVYINLIPILFIRS
jgi:iron complex transport system substrate-binding protein